MVITAADLFCGAGGMSAGLIDAARAAGKRSCYRRCVLSDGETG